MPRPSKSREQRQEIIVLVMGATRAGKSTFVNYMVQDERLKCEVGHKMTPCTSKLHPVRLTFPDDPLLNQYTIILVDTPGFNETVQDAKTFQLIQSYQHRRILGGVIYLHDISSDRILKSALRNLETSSRLCGGAALNKFIIGTTKWNRITPDVGKKHEGELKQLHCRAMLDKGAEVKQFEDSYDSALSFVKKIVGDREIISDIKATTSSRKREHRAESRQEIIIPVMGASGVGKSTFVNYLVQYGPLKSEVGHKLNSCTSDPHPIPLTFPNDPVLQQYTILLVDTPGFDDTYIGDAAILQNIANWLEKAYRNKKVLGGVIYLHDISCDRFSGTARRNLEMFNHMCGNTALRNVIIGTTKWGRTSLDIGRKYEDELKQVHWRPMLGSGAKTKRFEDSYDSALSFIKEIVRDRLLHICLLIQQEMVDDKKIIPETQAGKELRYTLKEALDMQRKMLELEKSMAEGRGDETAQKAHAEAVKKMDALVGQIELLKVPFLRRLKKFFGFF